jgi:hypothetical protein
MDGSLLSPSGLNEELLAMRIGELTGRWLDVTERSYSVPMACSHAALSIENSRTIVANA